MKPKLSEYQDWFLQKFKIDLRSKSSSIYQYVLAKIKRDFEESDFWQSFNSNLVEYNDEYYLLNNYPLLKMSNIPVFSKPYDSVINKSYRKNIWIIYLLTQIRHL